MNTVGSTRSVGRTSEASRCTGWYALPGLAKSGSPPKMYGTHFGSAPAASRSETNW